VPDISPPVTARHLLEGWLRARAPSLEGPVLDVGTARGERAWFPVERVTLDVTAARGVDLVGDIQNLHAIADGTYGSVVCTEVLEHVLYPERALRELRRVTRPGGLCLVSVPWLYPFHPCPLDLRRFTLQGLVTVMQDSGWTIVEQGGLPIPPEAHAHIVTAIQLITGGRCPRPETMGYSNWVVTARA
jgi:SAM-dependent methyltransferase